MREKTKTDLTILITELRKTFNKDKITRQEYLTFTEQRKDVYVPVGPFHQICLSKTERATFDLTLFDEALTQEATQTQSAYQYVKQEVIEETDDEILDRIRTRFQVINMMAKAATVGNCRSMIIAGAAGVGKSFCVYEALKMISKERYSIFKGKVSPAALYRALWAHRNHGDVILLDDCDIVFDNETSLNLLKAACDSSEERLISWASNAEMADENGDIIPETFEFNGSMIFISNKDFISEIARETKLSPHLSAMMSRSHYLSAGITTIREYVLRIKDVMYNTSMMDDCDDRTRDEVFQFIEMNAGRMYDLSLRAVTKIVELTKVSYDEWRTVAEHTMIKGIK